VKNKFKNFIKIQKINQKHSGVAAGKLPISLNKNAEPKSINFTS